jgi:ABC-2 type transport system permease protein
MNCVKAEHLKLKRTFTKKLIWLAPVVTALFGAVLMAGQSFQQGSYNWWYSMLLPGMLSLLCAGVIQKDTKKLCYRALLDLPVDPAEIWLGKIGVCVWLFFVLCVIFFIAVTLGGFVYGSGIPFWQSAFASLTLFATFLWQIPVCMVLADRLGLLVAVFLNFAANVVFLIGTAKTVWWIPYSIPARLMCPVIKVMPNGLVVPDGDPLQNPDVILPGILISLVLFASLSALTALQFRKKEAR